MLSDDELNAIEGRYLHSQYWQYEKDVKALLAHIREMEGERDSLRQWMRDKEEEEGAVLPENVSLGDYCKRLESERDTAVADAVSIRAIADDMADAARDVVKERDDARAEVETLNQKLIGWSLPTTGTFEDRLMRLIEQERAATIDLSPEVGALRTELQSTKQAHAELCRAHDGYRDEVARLTKLLDYCAVCGKTVADERCSLADDEMSPCTFPPKCMERIHAAEIEVARLRDVLISLSVASDIQFSEAAFNRVQQVIDDTERANDA